MNTVRPRARSDVADQTAAAAVTAMTALPAAAEAQSRYGYYDRYGHYDQRYDQRRYDPRYDRRYDQRRYDQRHYDQRYYQNCSGTTGTIVGAIAGWLAGMLVKGAGFGLIGDIVVGIVGVFIAGWLLPRIGIAIGGVWREIEGTLAELPSERTAEQAAPTAGDELAARRAARQTG